MTNVCVFVGNLTRDPEVKYTTQGKAVCNVGMAINRKSGDKEQVTFLDLVAWEKTAELMGEYLKKGSPVAVTCRARQETWEDRETKQNRSKIVFDVSEIKFLGNKSAGGDDSGGDAQTQKPSGGSKKQNYTPPASSGDDNGDDVPF